ncbi:ABC transporter ATP-binding protein [Streptomyces sp. NPDC088124]|uniref:ABC transporter ATP-binding protein n=1 Tax=Streptomyces sp. NPDC088124 TaxID=3154654 RepID=UPI003419DD3F
MTGSVLDRSDAIRNRRGADRLLLRVTRNSGPWAPALMVTALIVTVAQLCLPALLGRALDDALSGRFAGPWTAGCAAVVLLLVTGEALSELATGHSAARATAWLRHRLLDHLLALGPRTGSRFPGGDLVSRVVTGAADAAGAVSAATWLVLSLVPTVGGVVALWLIDPWLAVTFLLALPPLLLCLRAFTRDVSEVITGYQRTQGALATALVDALTGIRTIAAAGTADREAVRVLDRLPELNRLGHGMWRAQTRMAAQTALLIPLLEVAVLGVAGFALAGGRISLGQMVAAAQYTALAAGLGMTTVQLGRLARARAGGRRAAEVLAEPGMSYGTGRLPEGPGRLELRDVAVSRRGVRVLDGIDLVVPGGTSVAVVGGSGAGKSLLAAVAGRLADPDRGTVLLDGVPLPRLSRPELRSAVGHAFERPALFGATMAGAIGYGAREPSPERIAWAAGRARLDHFVQHLPEGYGTPLADVPMSGGEAQRIGLARAFAHAGRLLVLDDATSSLDTVTERQVTLALTEALGDRTRILVAHRASTAAAADQVVWLDGGRIRNRGTHRELWHDPEYRRLFRPVRGDWPAPGDRLAPDDRTASK